MPGRSHAELLAAQAATLRMLEHVTRARVTVCPAALDLALSLAWQNVDIITAKLERRSAERRQQDHGAPLYFDEAWQRPMPHPPSRRTRTDRRKA